MTSISRAALRKAMLFSLLSTPGHAQTYFESCAEALPKPPFHALAAYLRAKNKALDPSNLNAQPDECFRLNDHEFLVLSAGSYGIYHCDFKSGDGCNVSGEFEDTLAVAPTVSKEFTDKTGKHFVLLNKATLEHGIFTEAFYGLYLIPPSKSAHGLPFAIQPLIHVSVNGDSDELAEDTCKPQTNGWYPHAAPDANDAINGVTIGDDRDGKAMVTVQIAELNCHTDKRSRFSRVFRFDGTRFAENFRAKAARHVPMPP